MPERTCFSDVTDIQLWPETCLTSPGRQVGGHFLQISVKKSIRKREERNWLRVTDVWSQSFVVFLTFPEKKVWNGNYHDHCSTTWPVISNWSLSNLFFPSCANTMLPIKGTWRSLLLTSVPVIFLSLNLKFSSASLWITSELGVSRIIEKSGSSSDLQARSRVSANRLGGDTMWRQQDSWLTAGCDIKLLITFFPQRWHHRFTLQTNGGGRSCQVAENLSWMNADASTCKLPHSEGVSRELGISTALRSCPFRDVEQSVKRLCHR